MTHRKRKRGGSGRTNNSKAATDDLVENVGKFQEHLNNFAEKPVEKHTVKMVRSKNSSHQTMSGSESDDDPVGFVSRMSYESE